MRVFGQQVASYSVVVELSPVAVAVLHEAGSQARAGFLHCATISLVVKFLVHGSTCGEEGVGGSRARHGGGGGESVVFTNEIKLCLLEQNVVTAFCAQGAGKSRVCLKKGK